MSEVIAGIPTEGIPTPESNKLKAVRPNMAELKHFVSFLEENNIHLCESLKSEDRFAELDYVRTPKSIDSLLFEFFEIDPQKVEQERMKVLEVMVG